MDSLEGIYLDLRGGASFLMDSETTEPGITSRIVGDFDFDPGYVVEGAVGYEHDSGFRGEVEIGYRKHDLDTATIKDDGGLGASAGLGSLNGLTFPGAFAGALVPSINGDIETISVMANGYYAVDTGTGFRPFVGAGVGVAFMSLDTSFLTVSSDENSTELAYKAMAGIEYEFDADFAAFLLGVRYSYFATTDPKFGDSNFEHGTHNVLASVRLRL